AIPNFIADATDRNRTSPFAFTGNKFEFRMLGSNQSIAGPNIALNTIVSEVLGSFADELEQADNFDTALIKVLRRSLKEHKRVVFNGNNYSDEWVKEAERRGLPNLKTTCDAFSHYCMDKNIEVFSKHNIYSPSEIYARQEIHLAEYSKTINIEALTMLSMARREILPAVLDFTKDLAQILTQKKALGDFIDATAEETLLGTISTLSGSLVKKIENLDTVVTEGQKITSYVEKARFYQENVISAMETLRKTADELETMVSEKYWPYPIYEDLLFYV
ncbi:MAG: glutamine synthetase type III, partial [Eubacterium sp.]